MNYIIHLENGLYFAGWDKLGEQKFVPEKEHAYRMLRTVAMRTQPKIHFPQLREQLKVIRGLCANLAERISRCLIWH